MAFNAQFWTCTGGESAARGDGVTTYSYRTTDLPATVATVGYFDAVNGLLAEGDIIDVSLISLVAPGRTTRKLQYTVDRRYQPFALPTSLPLLVFETQNVVNPAVPA